MNAYEKKVDKEKEKTAENEIRVTSKGQIKNYLGYAFRVLNKTDHKDLIIKATGNAIVKAVILIELVKRRVGELHQRNHIYSMELTDVFEPKLEGLDKIE
jgi:ribonuclease P/MRP protein subunit RPP25